MMHQYQKVINVIPNFNTSYVAAWSYFPENPVLPCQLFFKLQAFIGFQILKLQVYQPFKTHFIHSSTPKFIIHTDFFSQDAFNFQKSTKCIPAT